MRKGRGEEGEEEGEEEGRGKERGERGERSEKRHDVVMMTSATRR